MITPSVHLYSFTLDVSASRLDAHWGLLNRGEQARASRFRFPQLKNRWVAARANLKHILSQYCLSPPEQLRFDYEKNGKPVLAEQSAPPDLYFNLSHSHNHALLGVTRLAPIGVDLEYQQAIPDWQDLARHFFSRCEYRQLMTLPEAQRQKAFYCCWTRKEAVVKATGEGLSAALSSFDVSVAPHEPAEVIADTHPNPRADRWQLKHLEVGDDFVGAVALRSSQDFVIEEFGARHD